MIGRMLVERAAAIAEVAHAGQVDKAGRPYIEHPARVASRTEAAGAGDVAQAAAWLHDVVEDTPVTLDQLGEEFPPEVVAVVDAVTKRAGEPVEAYYGRVAADPIARAVKLADLTDNSSPERLALLDEVTRRRLTLKYSAGFARLAAGV